MKLRDFQVHASGLDKATNLRLSVLSELGRLALEEAGTGASFSKLLVRLVSHEEMAAISGAYVAGGIAHVVGGIEMSLLAVPEVSRFMSGISDAVLTAVTQLPDDATDDPSALDLTLTRAFRTRPPFSHSIAKLSPQRKGVLYETSFRFGFDFSEVIFGRADLPDRKAILASSPGSFVPLWILFDASKMVWTSDEVAFVGRGGNEMAKVRLGDLL
jgi:hypothetical protein